MWLFQNMDIVRMVDQIIAATVIKPEWEFVLNALPAFWQNAAEVLMSSDEKRKGKRNAPDTLDERIFKVFDGDCPTDLPKQLIALSKAIEAIVPASALDTDSGLKSLYIPRMPGGKALNASLSTRKEHPQLTMLLVNAVSFYAVLEHKARPMTICRLAVSLYLHHYIYKKTMDEMLQHDCARALRFRLATYLRENRQRTIRTAMLDWIMGPADNNASQSKGKDDEEELKQREREKYVMWDARFVSWCDPQDEFTDSAATTAEEREQLQAMINMKGRWSKYKEDIKKLQKVLMESTIARYRPTSRNVVEKRVADLFDQLVSVRLDFARSTSSASASADPPPLTGSDIQREQARIPARPQRQRSLRSCGTGRLGHAHLCQA